MMRLAIITSHPIQYCAPWFRFLAGERESGESSVERGVKREGSPLSPLFSSLKVFFLWDGAGKMDRGFGVPVKWDLPLLDGYDYEFVPNMSSHPGPSRVSGLNNPSLGARITAFRPDAVLVFGYNYLAHYRFLISGLAKGVPLLFRGDSHRLLQMRNGECGVGSGGWRELLRRRWIAAVFRRFAGFLYVGQANHDYFRYHGVEEKRLFFAPHCVDNKRFYAEMEAAGKAAAEWRRELAIPAQHRVVLFAGKLEPKKRPGDLLEAFRQANMPEITLVFVGSGVLEPVLRRQSNGCANIRFAPFQNQTLMPRTYMLGDLFVLPSFGSGETWGLAINEAMCMGRPVIVSDHVGCAKDLVQPGRNGLVFPAGNVPALAAALQDALAEPPRLIAWGQQSRKIIKDYSYEQATKGLLSALEFVVPRRPQASAP
jgi:glycosyltransferase involved in cell wall biosynthesis